MRLLPCDILQSITSFPLFTAIRSWKGYQEMVQNVDSFELYGNIHRVELKVLHLCFHAQQ